MSSAETAGLIALRGEEMASEDAHHSLAARYRQSVFANLAGSQTSRDHMVTAMMTRLGVTDPIGSLPAGSVTDPAVQRRSDAMMRDGSESADRAVDATATSPTPARR